MEIWKDALGRFSGRYSVSSFGRVKSLSRVIFCSDGITRRISERLLKPTLKWDGYLEVKLYDNSGGSRTYLVHRLVLETFVGPCPEGQECRHLDRKRTNNSLKNICWGTPKENGEDKKRHGTTNLGVRGRHYNQGEKHPTAKLTEEQVREIRRLHEVERFSNCELGRRFGVHNAVISMIVHRKTWSHVK